MPVRMPLRSASAPVPYVQHVLFPAVGGRKSLPSSTPLKLHQITRQQLLRMGGSVFQEILQRPLPQVHTV